MLSDLDEDGGTATAAWSRMLLSTPRATPFILYQALRADSIFSNLPLFGSGLSLP